MKYLIFLFLSCSIFAQDFRIIAIGDLHGDFGNTLAVLKKARVIDDKLEWIGGKTKLVQTGDEIDRGNEERKIMDFFETLKEKAKESGGEVYPLLGNHEIMNAELDFRFVFDGGWTEFEEFSKNYQPNPASKLPKKAYGRAFAFSTGGPYAKIMAGRLSILKLHDIIFLHGGLLPQYASRGIEVLNMEVSNWLMGVSKKPDWVGNADGPFWSRNFSSDTTEDDCALLKETLKITKSKLMVVSHTVQNEINSACDGLVYRIDVGLAKYYNGPIQALEILPNQVNIIR